MLRVSFPLSWTALAITVTVIVAVITVGAFTRITAHGWASFFDQSGSRLGSSGEAGKAVMSHLGVPGGPAPRYIEAERESSRKVIVPGESTAVTFTLTNIWDTQLEVSVQETATLTGRNWGADEGIPVTLTSFGLFSDSLEPGEELTGVVNITSEMSAGLHPGSYTIQIDSEIWPPAKLEPSRLGFYSGFVVIPPEGVLITTMAVRQLREARETGITLEEIRFSAEKTTIETLAAPLTGKVDVPFPFPAPERTAKAQSQGSEYRVPSSLPLITQLASRYRIDGGPWRQSWGHSYGLAAEGIKHEWKIDPVSVHARKLEIAVMPETGQDSADEAPWQWAVDLRENN